MTSCFSWNVTFSHSLKMDCKWTTPKANNKALKKFLKREGLSTTFLTCKVTPHQQAEYSQCYSNNDCFCEANTDYTPITGWSCYQYASKGHQKIKKKGYKKYNEFMLEHHCVAQHDDGHIVDVTPCSWQQGKRLFIIDDRLPLEDVQLMTAVDNETMITMIVSHPKKFGKNVNKGQIYWAGMWDQKTRTIEEAVEMVAELRTGTVTYVDENTDMDALVADLAVQGITDLVIIET